MHNMTGWRNSDALDLHSEGISFGSNVDSSTSYTDWSFCNILYSIKTNFSIHLQLRHKPFLSHPLQFIS